MSVPRAHDHLRSPRIYIAVPPDCITENSHDRTTTRSAHAKMRTTKCIPPRCSPGDETRSRDEDACERQKEVQHRLPLHLKQMCLQSSWNSLRDLTHRLHHIHPVLNLSERTVHRISYNPYSLFSTIEFWTKVALRQRKSRHRAPENV